MKTARQPVAVLRIVDQPRGAVARPTLGGGCKIYCAMGELPSGEAPGDPPTIFVPLSGLSTVSLEIVFSYEVVGSADTTVRLYGWATTNTDDDVILVKPTSRRDVHLFADDVAVYDTVPWSIVREASEEELDSFAFTPMAGGDVVDVGGASVLVTFYATITVCPAGEGTGDCGEYTHDTDM